MKRPHYNSCEQAPCEAEARENVLRQRLAMLAGSVAAAPNKPA